MEKKIRIKASFDNTEFDRQMKTMKESLKTLYAPSDAARTQQQNNSRMQSAGLGQGMQGTARKFAQAAKQDMQELDKFIKAQAKGQDKLNQAIDNRAKKLKDLKKEYGDILKLGQEDLKLKKEIEKVENSRSRLSNQSMIKGNAINSALDSRDSLSESMKKQRVPLGGRERLMAAYKGGGLTGMAKAGGRMAMQNPLAAAGMGLGLIGAGINMATPIMTQEDSAERRFRSAQGAAVSGAGHMARDVMQGRGDNTTLWSKEQNKAMKKAMEEMQETRKTDNWKMAGTAATIAGGAATAATVVGAPIGAGIAAAGAAYGGYQMITNERMRNKMLGAMGSKEAGNRYETELASSAVSNYKQNLAAEKELNPFKQMGQEYYNRKMQGNLQSQRALGLSNKQFYGQDGYLNQNFNSGFTQQQMSSMSGQMSAAGASTEVARSPGMAMRMMRNMNMTNAGSVMGKLSGTMGGMGDTEEATIKVLAEGMRQGLDSSNYAEEQRKFATSVSSLVFKSGATDGEGAGRIASSFGSFLNDKTTRGIQGAQGAYATMQNMTSQSGGIRGAMQSANIMNNKDLSKLSFDQRMALMNLSEEDLNAGGNMVSSMAKKSGLSLEEFQKSATKAKRGSIGLRGSTDKLRQQYQDAMKNGDTEGAKQIAGELEAALYSEDQSTFKGKSRPEREAFVKSFGMGEVDQIRDVSAVQKKLGEGPTRLEDKTIAGRAKSEQLAMDEFVNIGKDLQGAANAAANMTKEIMKATATFSKAVQEDATVAAEDLAKALDVLAKQAEKQAEKKGDIGSFFDTQQPDAGNFDEQ